MRHRINSTSTAHHLTPPTVPSLPQISIVGDFEADEVETLALKYLGSIPESKRPEAVSMMPLPPLVEDRSRRFIQVHLPDSNPRAFVYVSGRTPNRWGFMQGGQKLADYLGQLAPEADENTKTRRAHPGFPFVSLLLIQEIMNRRLFSNIREKKQLTYDANFRWHPYDLYEGGWYSVQIAASPDNAKQVRCYMTTRMAVPGFMFAAQPALPRPSSPPVLDFSYPWSRCCTPAWRRSRSSRATPPSRTTTSTPPRR
jgi:hypothetical protein